MKFLHLSLAVVLVGVSAGVVHAQTAIQAPAPQTTAIIDPPIVPAPPPPAPPPASDLTMPKWSEFPVPPKDVPTPSDIAVRVNAENDDAKAFNAEVAGLNWDPDVAETFKAQTVARLDPDMYKAVDKPMDAASIEAFGNDLRRQATPPPVAN